MPGVLVDEVMQDYVINGVPVGCSSLVVWEFLLRGILAKHGLDFDLS